MAKLAIFDIDGTLVNSSKADEDCFAQSVDEAFGIKNIDTNWANYRNATDSSIFEEVFERALGRKPSGREITTQIEYFLRFLRQHCEQNPALFREVPGARAMLGRLARHPEWYPAIATGTWREAALFKLQAAGLDVKGIPMATASDAQDRETIIRQCIKKARAVYRKQFERIVSVGDAVWDQLTAKRLGIAFVKINTSGKRDSSGFPYVLEHFEDEERFLACLERAGVP